MAQQLVWAEEELARKAGIVRALSLGVMVTTGAAEIITIIIWLFNREYLIIPLTLVIVAGMLIASVTYWLVRAGKVRSAGYFFVIGLTLEIAIITTLFGGFTGPLAISYLFPILVAGMAISINASFLIATLAGVLYLAMIGVEQAGILPQLIAPGEKGAIIPYLTVGTRLVFFYLIAFLSWFAASRLNQALQSVRLHAAELKRANEQLQASEEELRAANEELQATEEELRASNEELQAANEELRETQEQLIRSEKLAAIGQLASGVGHELRNPLGAIKNAVFYIRRRIGKTDLATTEPRTLEFLDIMDEEVNAANKVITDLLGFSRVAKPTVSPVSLAGVIENALKHTPLPENVDLAKDIDKNLPMIMVDADQIRQVFINIVLNALQAMTEGGRLDIRARRRGEFVEVEFTDTGSGIPESVIDKIFDPLFTTKAKGVGLGLSVCKSITERHDGDIRVESEEGKGTTFTVSIPTKEAVERP
jgi:signal transduction histidine kinase